MENEAVQIITVAATITVVEIKTVTATVTLSGGADWNWNFATIVGIILAVAGLFLTVLGLVGAIAGFWGFEYLKTMVEDFAKRKVDERVSEIDALSAEESPNLAKQEWRRKPTENQQ